MIVNEREFFIWKLEKWWVCFNSPDFYPENRIHLIGNWFWRTKNLKPHLYYQNLINKKNEKNKK